MVWKHIPEHDWLVKADKDFPDDCGSALRDNRSFGGTFQLNATQQLAN